MKEEFLKENNLSPIDETNLNSILSKHFTDGFIIISSDRSEITDPAERNQHFKDLKVLISNNGYPFTPVFGGYREDARDENGNPIKDDNGQNIKVDSKDPERALLVPNQKNSNDASRDEDQYIIKLGMMLANRYQQETFLYKGMGISTECCYIKGDGTITDKFIGLTINDVIPRYFTKFDYMETIKISEIVEIYMHNHPKTASEAYRRFGEQYYRWKNEKLIF